MTTIEIEKMFKEKIESNFADMTKEEIISSIVSQAIAHCKLINTCETKGMASKGKDKKEWFSMANSIRMERQALTRLHNKVLKTC